MSEPRLFFGDITSLDVDAIVNAANPLLEGGGGVDGAIHRAGGPAIMAECDRIRHKRGGCPPGEAVITTAGRLTAKYVIHTVGPVWRGGMHNEHTILANAYTSSLRVAQDYRLKSLAFPNISTGIYGFPKEEAAAIAIATVREFIERRLPPDHVIFCCYDEENFRIYQSLLK